MSKKDVEKFLRLVRENKGLSDRLAKGMGSDEIEAIARENDLEFTSAELHEHFSLARDKAIKLSDSELDAATGGMQAICYAYCYTCNKRLNPGLVIPGEAINTSANHQIQFPGHLVDILE